LSFTKLALHPDSPIRLLQSAEEIQFISRSTSGSI